MTTLAPPPATELSAVTGSARHATERTLDAVLSIEARRWAGYRHAHRLVDDLRAAVFAPGKRLRPAFAYWGYAAATGTKAGALGGRLGAALELLHTFALIHDDVMDRSELRRGELSVHARIARLHTQLGWRGEQRRYAEGAAILVGDLAFAMANRLITEMPAGVVKVWHQMCGELVVGQHLDLVGAAAGDRHADFAEMVGVLKSGRYSVVRPLQLGAALAGALDSHGPLYARYGEPLGVAFQLRDDLLGAFGDPATTGKPVGQDLRDGKPTALLSLIARRAPTSAASLLDRVGGPELTDADIGELIDLGYTTGAVAEIERRIAAAVSTARSALTDPRLDRSARSALDALARAAAWRRR